MAIRPKRGFRTQTDSRNSKINLPTDGKASAYRALASLGGGMNKVATDMWAISEQQALDTEVSRLKDEYATGTANQVAGNQTHMRNKRDGTMSDGTTYSQRISENDEVLKDQISKSAASPQAEIAFRKSIAEKSRATKVKALTSEKAYVLESYIADSQEKSVKRAGDIAIAPKADYMEMGYKTYTDNKLKYMEDQEKGVVSKQVSDGLIKNSGANNANAMTDQIITHADWKAWNLLTGTNIQDTPEFKEMIKDYESRGVTVDEFINTTELNEEEKNKYKELREHLTPTKLAQTQRSLIRSMKDKRNSRASKLVNDYRNIKAEIADPSASEIGLQARSRKNINDFIKDGFEPHKVVEYLVGYKIAGMTRNIRSEVAQLSPNARKAYVDRLEGHFELSMQEMAREYPSLSGEIAENISGKQGRLQFRNAVVTLMGNQEIEKQEDNVTYISKHDKPSNRSYADGLSSTMPNSMVNVVDGIVTKSKQMGVRERNTKIIRADHGKDMGAKLDQLWNNGDPTSLGQLGEHLLVLREKYGEYFSPMMNEMAERKFTKDADSAMSMVANIKDTDVMFRSISDLRAYKNQKEAYDKSNVAPQAGKAKPFPFEPAFQKELSKYRKYFMSNAGNVSSPRAQEQLNKFSKIAEARFYTLSNKETAHPSNGKKIKLAFEQTMGTLFTAVENNGHKVLVPKQHGLPQSTISSAINVLTHNAKNAKLDSKAYAYMRSRFQGMSENATDEAIHRRIMSKIVIISPPPSGGDTGGLSIGVMSDHGIIPFIQLMDGKSTIHTIPFSEMKDNVDVKAQEAYDATNMGRFLDLF